jgi:hypothetical protein
MGGHEDGGGVVNWILAVTVEEQIRAMVDGGGDGLIFFGGEGGEGLYFILAHLDS